MHIRLLTDRDIPDALRLSTQAGWNQTEADWRRSIEVCGGLAFAGWVDDRVVATATIARFGDIGWVGMVLVDESNRGEGLGGAIFKHAVSSASQAGIKILGLDASDMGRPVYLKQGFVDHSQLIRWVGTARNAYSTNTRLVCAEDLTAICELDRSVSGVDRRDLLVSLATQGRVIGSDAIDGFGFFRAGRTASCIGPVVARSDDQARQLIESLLGDCDPAHPVLIDLPEGSSVVPQGFAVQRRLTRMVRPAINGKLLTDVHFYAGAGFEWG